MYSEDFFEGRSKLEVRKILNDNADLVENTEYFAPLTDEQLEAKRAEFAKISIEMASVEDEFDAVKQQFKNKLKPLKGQRFAILKTLRLKGELITGDVYTMFNHEEGFAYKYNSDGECIEKRRLRPDEKTSTLKFQSNVANS